MEEIKNPFTEKKEKNPFIPEERQGSKFGRYTLNELDSIYVVMANAGLKDSIKDEIAAEIKRRVDSREVVREKEGEIEEENKKEIEEETLNEEK